VAELERGLISDRTAALAVRKAKGVRLGRSTTVPLSVVDRIARERAAPTGQGGSKWFPNTVARIHKRAAA
jgi:hypothetical protein